MATIREHGRAVGHRQPKPLTVAICAISQSLREGGAHFVGGAATDTRRVDRVASHTGRNHPTVYRLVSYLGRAGANELVVTTQRFCILGSRWARC